MDTSVTDVFAMAEQRLLVPAVHQIAGAAHMGEIGELLRRHVAA